MQVTAATSAYTGSQRQTQPEQSFGKASKRSFADFLPSLDIPSVSEEEMDAALERALGRIEPLVGEDVAKSVVGEDGSINLARYAQAMIAAETPYGASPRTTPATMPQVVNMIA